MDPGPKAPLSGSIDDSGISVSVPAPERCLLVVGVVVDGRLFSELSELREFSCWSTCSP